MTLDETTERTETPQRDRPTRQPRRRFRRFQIVTHRWLSLVLGLVLLAITTSGAILLYRPEIQRSLNSDAYDTSGEPATISLTEAREIVLDAHPDFAGSSIWAEHGVYRVTDYETSWTVDPGTGEILGHVGEAPGWLLFMDNLHLCFLSCEEYPGYVPWLVEEVPGTGWLGFDGIDVTWGGLALGVLGLILVYLCLTGIWLWFPRPSQWRSSMNVRWKRGRFARDTDLHKVAGMVVLPFLLMWGLTAMSYEFGWVEKGWYAATPGGHREGAEILSEESDQPDITVDQAVAAARALHPDLTLTNVDLPLEDDPTGAYSMYFADGFDPWGHGEYPGDLGVFVDRHTGVATDYYGFPDESTAQRIYEDWNYPVHSGYVVNGWWRVLWLVFALSPLLLAVTGVSTWLVRLSTKRQRRRALRES